jgi:rod shape determining protein RodA
MMRRRVITADLPLIGVALALSLFGIAMVYSAGQTDVPTIATRAWVSQIKWLMVALVAAFLVSRASVRLIEWLTWPAFLFTVGLLVITLMWRRA